jgi:hypothetical protein
VCGGNKIPQYFRKRLKHLIPSCDRSSVRADRLLFYTRPGRISRRHALCILPANNRAYHGTLTCIYPIRSATRDSTIAQSHLAK